MQFAADSYPRARRCGHRMAKHALRDALGLPRRTEPHAAEATRGGRLDGEAETEQEQKQPCWLVGLPAFPALLLPRSTLEPSYVGLPQQQQHQRRQGLDVGMGNQLIMLSGGGD
ncbi:Os08g0321750 [Oryza sativa Japonica Group]|uniref:Os08g0321750 protein n=1 Tax=Oryza sativa subsp. japonica TaxID=39947 RepID=A0A0P0XEX9_ORYSJ|nr:Os08g0321750 [Oryza sativa Japonica Group]